MKRLAPVLFVLAVMMMGSVPSARGAAGAVPFQGAARPFQSAAQPLQATSPFLSPPFPGRTSEESIFDHSSPNYTTNDARIVISTGEVLRKNCLIPAPSGTPPPERGVCKYPGFHAYWSYKLGDWVFYNGHDGIDYGISYRPIYAAADADQVMFAGWHNQSNHGFGLGLYIKLRHPNGYQTYYAHLSAINVQTCTGAGCAPIKQGDIIGLSGTTGNSSGPHLHFSVNNPSGIRVDPYGWRGSQADPWTANQRESLWISPPDTSAGDRRDVYPSGEALSYPPAPAIFSTIDDGGPGFSESPAGCWKVVPTNGSQSQNASMRAVRPVTGGSPTCRADWAFPGGPAGRYAVYVRIPWVHATSQSAVYEIHAGGGTQRAIVNQAVFPNFTVTDGWIYLGTYSFAGGDTEFVRLTNRTLDEQVSAPSLELGADAMRFAPLATGPTFTPTLTLTSSITPAVTITPMPSNTPTPSREPTPSRTPSPTLTRTVTRMRTPTSTPRPSDTRWPTLTRTPTRTPTATRTATITRTPTPTRTPVMIVYQNAAYGYRISYPSGGTFTVNTPTQQKIQLPFAPGTNLAEKYAQIDVSTSPPTCASSLGPARTSQDVTINGISFLKQVGSQAAAGSLYDWTAYSAQNGTACVSVGFVLRSLDPAVFPTPPPQFDAVAESSIFDRMIATFGWITP